MLSRMRCFIRDQGQVTTDYTVALMILAIAGMGLFIAFSGGVQGALATLAGLV